jgi:hypothetical protein
VGGDAVIGHAVPGGKTQDLEVRGKKGERLGEFGEPGIVAGDVQHRPLPFGAAAGDEKGIESFRRPINGKSRHDA